MWLRAEGLVPRVPCKGRRVIEALRVEGLGLGVEGLLGGPGDLVRVPKGLLKGIYRVP